MEDSGRARARGQVTAQQWAIPWKRAGPGNGLRSGNGQGPETGLLRRRGARQRAKAAAPRRVTKSRGRGAPVRQAGEIRASRAGCARGRKNPGRSNFGPAAGNRGRPRGPGTRQRGRPRLAGGREEVGTGCGHAPKRDQSPREDTAGIPREPTGAGGWKTPGATPKGERPEGDHVTSEHDTAAGRNTPEGGQTAGELSTRRRLR